MNKTALLAASMLMAGVMAIASGTAIAADPGTSSDPATLQVEATDNIFASGLTSKNLTTDQGSMPQSIPVTSGQKLMLSATGTVLCCGNGQPGVDADGFAHNPFGSGTHVANPFRTRVVAFNDPGAFAPLGVFNGPTVAAHTPFKIGTARP
jgi:hypothetical protein